MSVIVAVNKSFFYFAFHIYQGCRCLHQWNTNRYWYKQWPKSFDFYLINIKLSLLKFIIFSVFFFQHPRIILCFIMAFANGQAVKLSVKIFSNLCSKWNILNVAAFLWGHPTTATKKKKKTLPDVLWFTNNSTKTVWNKRWSGRVTGAVLVSPKRSFKAVFQAILF